MNATNRRTFRTTCHPAYHAVRAAEEYAELTGAVLIYGSATPPVELLYRARREGLDVSAPAATRAGAPPGGGGPDAGPRPGGASPAHRRRGCQPAAAGDSNRRYAAGTAGEQPQHLQPGPGRQAETGGRCRAAGHPVPQPARHGHLHLLPGLRRLRWTARAARSR